VVRDPGDLLKLGLPVPEVEAERNAEDHRLAAARDNYRTLLMELPLLVWKSDAAGGCEYVNQAWQDFTGLPLEALLGDEWTGAVHPEDRETLQRTYADAFQTRLPMGLEFRMRHRSGEYRWVLGSGKPFYDLDGQFAGFLAACDDIHGIRTAERRIRRLTDLYSALSHTNHAIVHARDRQRLFQEVCRIAVGVGKFRLAWIGLADPEHGGFRPVAHAGPASAYLDDMRNCATATEPGGLGLDAVVLLEGESRIERDLPASAPCGACRSNAVRNGLRAQAAFPLRVGGRIEGSFSVFSEAEDAFDPDMIALLNEMAEDISFALDHLAHEERRIAAEGALALALQERQAMLEAASVARVVPWSMDPEGILRWGDSAGLVLGQAPADLGQRPGWPWHLLLEEDQPRLRQALREADMGLVASAECRMHHGAGRTIWTRWTLAREGSRFRGAVQDITEQHTVQEQLFQSQKLESLGTLVGGIAHDFNNLLMAILGYGEIFDRDPSFTPRQRKGLDVIHRAAQRGRDLVDRLLGFSRKVPPRRASANLNTILSEAEALLVHALSNRIQLVLDPAPGLPDLCFDSGQLHQVVMNLAINARDAIQGEGTITLRSGLLCVPAETALRHQRLPGDYAYLEVEDTGCGIPADRLRRIFEPFYTTKGAKGTGLGLSMVHGIVTDHGGFVECASELGTGTRIRMLLPMVSSVERTGDPTEGGDSSMRVLLACGESARSRLAMGLGQMGHHVVADSSAAGAAAGIGGMAWDLLVLEPSALDMEPGAFLEALSRRGWTGPFVLFGQDRPGALPRPACGHLPLDFTLMDLVETLHLSCHA
jgi:PAS domain S-box-containing protein